MRLKGYILEGHGPQGGRGKWIDEDTAMELLSKKCGKSFDHYNKTGVVLYRGMPGNGDYYQIDPKSSTRRSQYTDNYYTLVMDNDPRWSKFPKRSESLICTTREGKASGYGGTVMQVFPYDGANFGVASGDDIWESFEQNNLRGDSLGELNSFLNGIASYYDLDGFRSMTTYKKFMYWLDRFEAELQTTKDRDVPIIGKWPSMLTRLSSVADSWIADGAPPFKKWYQDIFDPADNDMYATKDIKKVFGKGAVDKEVWTDSKAILVTKTNF